MYLKNFAENWEDFLGRLYPPMRGELWRGPKKIELSLPLDEMNENKEQEFKQRVTNDSKKIIEKFKNMGKLRAYWQCIKEGHTNNRAAHIGTVLLAEAYFIHPVLGVIAPLAFGGYIEYTCYKKGKEDRMKAIENLEKLGDNILVHYVAITKKKL